jgi:hypothetical protein
MADIYIRAGALRRWLETIPDDRLVVLAKDAEGNNFSPLSELEVSSYEAASTWNGDLTDNESGERCVVLWPVN